MSTVEYKVPNISCDHCVHTIKMEIGDLEGVENVEADMNTQQVKVLFGDPASEEKIVSLLEEINYAPAGV